MKEDNTAAQTSATLLGRLRNAGDQAAWVRFIERYGRMIYSWCRGRGLHDADAEDATQEVLMVLSETLRTFQYDPTKGKFRNYLQVVTRRATGRLAARQACTDRPGNLKCQEILEALEARDDLASTLQKEFDLELLEIARSRVAQRVDARTMQAYELTAVGGLSGEEAAARLEMKAAAVYMARSRVLKLLREEVQRLDDQE